MRAVAPWQQEQRPTASTMPAEVTVSVWGVAYEAKRCCAAWRPMPRAVPMMAEVTGEVIMVALAPSRSGDPWRCRPIGCYVASSALAATYRKDRHDV